MAGLRAHLNAQMTRSCSVHGHCTNGYPICGLSFVHFLPPRCARRLDSISCRGHCTNGYPIC
eukprot:8830130-Lingulodinium_polyedra.AAC.1